MDTMEKQRILLQQYLDTAQTSLSEKPEGKLLICRNRSHDQYYCKPNPKENKRVYISKTNLSLIKSLAQKDYDLLFIRAVEKLALETEDFINRNLCRDIHDFYQTLAKVYTDLSPSRKNLVTPYVLPDDMYVQEWEKSFIEVKVSLKMLQELSQKTVNLSGRRVRKSSLISYGSSGFRTAMNVP